MRGKEIDSERDGVCLLRLAYMYPCCCPVRRCLRAADRASSGCGGGDAEGGRRLRVGGSADLRGAGKVSQG